MSPKGGAWHHVIPYAMLRDVWNRLVEAHIDTEIPEARQALWQYLSLCQRDLPRREELVSRMRADNTSQSRAGHSRLTPLSEIECVELQRAAVWPAWDVVEGPASRSDEPAPGQLDRFTRGLPAGAGARMAAIEVLFNHFRQFLDGGAGPVELRRLSQSCAAGRLVLGGLAPIPYRDEMWVPDGAGGWRKSRSARNPA